MLWCVENFFAYADKNYHELALYFLMGFPVNCRYIVESGPFLGEEIDGAKLTFQWFEREPEVLGSLPLLPSFLQTAIQELPESAQHIVHHDVRDPG